MATKPATPGTGFRGPLYILDEDGEATQVAAIPVGTANDLTSGSDTTAAGWSAKILKDEIKTNTPAGADGAIVTGSATVPSLWTAKQLRDAIDAIIGGA